eukprot:scaffold2868_cov38-Cyclotella_meneghiniana.AAC.1
MKSKRGKKECDRWIAQGVQLKTQRNSVTSPEKFRDSSDLPSPISDLPSPINPIENHHGRRPGNTHNSVAPSPESMHRSHNLLLICCSWTESLLQKSKIGYETAPTPWREADGGCNSFAGPIPMPKPPPSIICEHWQLVKAFNSRGSLGSVSNRLQLYADVIRINSAIGQPREGRVDPIRRLRWTYYVTNRDCATAVTLLNQSSMVIYLGRLISLPQQLQNQHKLRSHGGIQNTTASASQAQQHPPTAHSKTAATLTTEMAMIEDLLYNNQRAVEDTTITFGMAIIPGHFDLISP